MRIETPRPCGLMKTCEHALSLVLCAAIALGVGACAARGRASSSAEAPAAGADESLARARAQLDEASAALERGDHAAARAKASEAIDGLLSQDERGDDPDRIAILFALGYLAQDAGDLKAAERAGRRVLEVRARTLPEDHPDLQAARLNLGTTIYRLGDLQGARALFEKVLEVRTRSLPADHPDLQAARRNLAATIHVLGDLEGARVLFEQVLDVGTRTLPEDHPDLQAARQNLAASIKALGELQEARALEERVLEVGMRTLPEDHPDLQMARGNLAATLYALGDLQGARALQERVLEVRTRTLPADHLDLQAARVNLAITTKVLGDLQTARALEEQALEVFARMLPEDHPDLQAVRQNLAVTIGTLGDHQGARALQEQSLEALARTLPEDHPMLPAVRQNLAGTIEALGDLQGARALYEEVLEFRTRTLPEDHPDLQSARSNLARTIRMLGHLEEAQALEEQVLEVLERTLPEDHPELQSARQNLAQTMKAFGDLEGARALEERLLEVRTRTHPEDHPDLQWARMNLATTIAALCAGASGGDEKGAREQWASLVHDFSEAATRIARAATLSSSSREAEERCSSLGHFLSNSLSLAAGFGVFDADPLLARDAFVLSETTRAGALASARIARLTRTDERCTGLREEARAAGAELARLAQSGATRDAYDAVIARRDRAQRELVRLSTASADAAGFLFEPDPAALAKRLSEADAVVAYRRYTRTEISLEARETRATESLCAFVLRKDAELRFVDLGEIEPVAAAVKDWRLLLGTPIERGASVGSTQDMARRLREKGEILRRLVFDPLLPAGEGVDRLFVALDDVLHGVPLDALPSADEPSGLLGDRYRIEVLLSLTELGRPSLVVAGPAVLLALGGASFNSQPLPRTAAEGDALDARVETPTEVAALPPDGAWDRGFVPLTHTGLEARAVAELFGETFGAAAKQGRGGPSRAIVLEKREASRAAVEELAPSARFLHLATHGWFAPESVRSWSDPVAVQRLGQGLERTSAEERVRGSSPMLLCGLALAGANLPADAVGRYPGLVTAEEISGWDLSACELAVLSACDTAVGERRAGQGVASLQRALHMAGARTVITSLWKVPDEATKELMLDFYRRIWVEKKPKSAALWEAKRRLRDARNERGEPIHSTRDWAAWVLTGDPD